MMNWLRELGEDVRELLRDGWQVVLHRRWLFFLVLPLTVALGVIFILPRDAAISNWLITHRYDKVHASPDHWLLAVARGFSKYGDFRVTIELFLLYLMAGAIKKRRDWQRIGVAVMLAAALAGLVTTVIRTTTGRPRPSTMTDLPKSILPDGTPVVDRFYGFHPFDSDYQSFPSAHATTAMATATVMAEAAPQIGIPFAIISIGVPWSRFYMHAHNLGDILVGSCIGLWFGFAIGPAARRCRGN